VCFRLSAENHWIRLGNCSTKALEELLRFHHDDIQALETDQMNGVLTLF
jgi:predicted nuclease of predicted toxin-antitoxin system